MQGLERYDRQIRLPGFGALAQQKLRNANVLVVGAGGLGCPVLQYLVAAGVGHIGIADEDIVTLSNLQRQVLYNEGNVGSNKAVVAAQKLSAYNSTIRITPIENRLMPSNCAAIVEPYELIVDCTDNFATRYLLADASVLLDKIVVYGAVSRYEGQVAVFNALSDGKRSAGYRDLFPLPPEPGEVQDCSEAGVLGVLPGIIGAMQAAEVIKLITGIGETLINQLLTYSLLDHQSYIVRFSANEKNRQFMPRSLQELALFDYGESCSFSQTAKVLDAILFDRILGNPLIQIIDCREEGELPLVTDFDHIQMPVSKIDIQDIRFAHGEHVFFCQSGKRSKSVADRLSNRYGDPVRFSTLDEGILSWIQYKQSFKHSIHEE